ncbi:MAG: ABC transporter ATP-binding protein [Clostridia bacterium]|nr:ABC transporter ATP-binding protein [Clostridia bacterium]
MSNLLEMINVTKQFPGVLANDNVNFMVKKGEIHALLGENGAGKSTLMNILYGLYKQTSGQILINGEELEIASPNDAIKLGIGMVHQHFMLIPPLTVVENIILGLIQGTFLNIKDSAKKITEISKQYGMNIDPYAKIWQLSVGQQQRVEIIKVLFRGAKLLILDEPTAVLTPQETTDLFKMIRRLAEEGHTIIFISHKLNEVKAISNRVTVLRRGKTVGTVQTVDITKDELARMMVGRNVCFKVDKVAAAPKQTILKVDNLTALNNKGLRALNNVSIEVRAGEIFGIAGVDGNGQSELVETITGLRKAISGNVYLNDKNITNLHPREILESKVSHIPEDRHRMGLVLGMTLKENFILQTHYKVPFSKGRFKFLDWKFIQEHSCKLIEEYDIRTPNENVLAQNLSGGNQQKLVLAREIFRDPDLLIAMHPTRGLDCGAIEFVHKKIVEQRDDNKAVLLVSTELDEIFALSDRIAVIYEGEIMGIVDPDKITIEEIGMMMAGSKAEQVGA